MERRAAGLGFIQKNARCLKNDGISWLFRRIDTIEENKLGNALRNSDGASGA